MPAHESRCYPKSKSYDAIYDILQDDLGFGQFGVFILT